MSPSPSIGSPIPKPTPRPTPDQQMDEELMRRKKMEALGLEVKPLQRLPFNLPIEEGKRSSYGQPTVGGSMFGSTQRAKYQQQQNKKLNEAKRAVYTELRLPELQDIGGM